MLGRPTNLDKIIGTLEGQATLQFSFLPPFSKGINSERKLIAPPRAKNLLLLKRICSFKQCPLSKGHCHL